VAVGRLTAYSLKHGHDKYDRYFPFFDQTLKGHKVRRLLEIGCSTRSLMTWLACFPGAEIVGLDASPFGPTGLDDNPALAEANERLTFVVGEQEDTELLLSLGEFDVIFDDGGHHSFQQITTFKTLFPEMPSRGWYFIEDLHCSYWPHYNERPPTTMNFTKDLLDDMHARYTEPPGESRWPIAEVRLLDSVAAFRRA
jgi:hypothetical protein